MDDPDSLFLERLKFLTEFVVTLDIQFGLLHAYTELVSDPELDETQKLIIQSTLPPLEERLLLSIAQLWADKHSGTNFTKFVAHYKEHKKRIPHANAPLIDQELERLTLFDDVKRQILRKLRDKSIAHLDREFTQNPQRFTLEHGFSLPEIEDSVDRSFDLVSKFNLAITGYGRMSVRPVVKSTALGSFRGTLTYLE